MAFSCNQYSVFKNVTGQLLNSRHYSKHALEIDARSMLSALKKPGGAEETYTNIALLCNTKQIEALGAVRTKGKSADSTVIREGFGKNP